MARTIQFHIIDADTGNDLQNVVCTVKKEADDGVLSTGNTDAGGLFTSGDQAAATEYYLEAEKAGYLSIVKNWGGAGANFEKILHWISPTADETQWVEIALQPDRARTQCVVYEGEGATSGAVQTPVAGATVLVKRTSDNVTIETLTTDANGVCYLDETAYGGVAHYVVVTKAGYNSRTLYRGTFVKAQSFAVGLKQSISHSTYNFKLHLIDASGHPIVGKTLYLDVMAMHSVTDTGEEYYVRTGERIALTTDANGDAETDIVEDLIVKPSSGWASYFGYPEGVCWKMTTDIVLGDSEAGLL